MDWYSCSSTHSLPLNANREAYAAWWLWARIAGWVPEGTDECPSDPGKTDPDFCGYGTPDIDSDGYDI